MMESETINGQNKKEKCYSSKYLNVEENVYICDPCRYPPVNKSEIKSSYASFWDISVESGNWVMELVSDENSSKIWVHHTKYSRKEISEMISKTLTKLGIDTGKGSFITFFW